MSTKYVLDPADRRRLLASPAGWIACGLGSGLTPRAQGTFGSLAAILPWLLLRDLPIAAWLVLIVASFALGVWACEVAGRILGVADHRSLVWDEFVGQWITLLPVALAPRLAGGIASGVAGVEAWWPVVAGFALFRLFDVWKPWPIAWFDRRVKGGLGVMLDDVIAGIFAAIVLQAILHYTT